MGFKCCVPGCRSGYQYSNSNSNSNISMHAFPSDNSLKKLWLHKIHVHRDNFTPSKHTRVCSLHFNENDFRLETKDSCNRLKNNPILRRRHLKEHAIPSIFPNQPSYLSSTPCQPRTSSTSAESRLERENTKLHELNKEFDTNEQINSLDELEKNLAYKIIYLATFLCDAAKLRMLFYSFL